LIRTWRFKQNVAESGLAVLVLVAHTNRRKELRLLMPALLDAISKVRPGDVIRVGGAAP
jgi:hypothetical protein